MKFSIITASYNYEKYISETIYSVINQSCKDWELIIVDDASSDNSVEIIRNFSNQDKRIRFFVNEKNLGLTKTLQKGLEEATGEWVAFLESDDIWDKDYLEEKIKVTEKYPKTDFIFNDIECFGDEKEVEISESFNEKTRKILSNIKSGQDFLNEMTFQNLIFTFSCVAVKKNVLRECNFNSPVDSHLDWWLWYQLIFKTNTVYLPKKLTKWRMHKKSYINKNIIKGFDFRKNLLESRVNGVLSVFLFRLFKLTTKRKIKNFGIFKFLTRKIISKMNKVENLNNSFRLW